MNTLQWAESSTGWIDPVTIKTKVKEEGEIYEWVWCSWVQVQEFNWRHLHHALANWLNQHITGSTPQSQQNPKLNARTYLIRSAERDLTYIILPMTTFINGVFPWPIKMYCTCLVDYWDLGPWTEHSTAMGLFHGSRLQFLSWV